MRIPSGIDLFSPGSFIYTRVRVSSAREGEQQVQQNEAPSSRAPLLGTLQERIGLFGYFRVRGAGAQEVTQRVQPSEASGPQEPLLDTLQKVETLRETLVAQSRPGRRTGAIMITDAVGMLVGIFTDSDLARLLEGKRDAAIDGPLTLSVGAMHDHLSRPFPRLQMSASQRL